VLAPPVHAPGGPPGGFDSARILGVEQEYDLFAGRSPLDFRALFARSLARRHSVPFRNCDSAAILDAGYMLACDGQEAEFATAPIDYHGEGCLTLAREVIRCRQDMLKLLHGIGIPDVRGYSTHLNISVPPGREWHLAIALSKTVAPALILLMEARQSPGLLIRPRRGRLEIGSEYIDHEDQLAAASVFLTGAVQACLFDEPLWGQFPRLSLKHWEEANIRPGVYLPHDAFGESIYEYGRAAKLELENGGTIRAGDLLEICSRLVLRALADKISLRAAKGLRRVVAHTGSLQIERPIDPGFIAQPVRFYSPTHAARTLQTLTLAQTRLGLTPRFVDWEGAAFSWETKSTSLVVGVPWAQLPGFFHTTHKNDLPRYVKELGAVGPELASLDQLQSPGVFHAIDPVALGHQALSDKGNGKDRKGDSPKPSGQSGEPPILPARKRLPWWRIGLTIVTLLVLIFTVGRLINNNSTFGRSTRTPTITLTSSLPVRDRTVSQPTPTWTSTTTSTPTWTPTPSVTLTPTRTRRPFVPPTDTPRPPPPQPCDPQNDPNCPRPPQPTVCDRQGNCR
jgi:hypothetical protein